MMSALAVPLAAAMKMNMNTRLEPTVFGASGALELD